MALAIETLIGPELDKVGVCHFSSFFFWHRPLLTLVAVKCTLQKPFCEWQRATGAASVMTITLIGPQGTFSPLLQFCPPIYIRNFCRPRVLSRISDTMCYHSMKLKYGLLWTCFCMNHVKRAYEVALWNCSLTMRFVLKQL